MIELTEKLTLQPDGNYMSKQGGTTVTIVPPDITKEEGERRKSEFWKVWHECYLQFLIEGGDPAELAVKRGE